MQRIAEYTFAPCGCVYYTVNGELVKACAVHTLTSLERRIIELDFEAGELW